MEQQQGMSLNEVLGETIETYLTLEDAMLLHDTFKDNPRLLRVLGKIFIPTIQDPEMPPESMAEDFWMAGKDWASMPVDEVKAMVAGRQEALKFIQGGLIRLKATANAKTESIQEMSQRRKKDSSK